MTDLDLERGLERGADRTPYGHGRMLRKEDRRLVRGRGRFTDDLQLPGMLHLSILRSPVAHARIERPREELDELCEHLLALRAQATGPERSNRGGWHSEGNLFGKEHREFPWLRELVVQAILDFAGTGLGLSGDFAF